MTRQEAAPLRAVLIAVGTGALLLQLVVFPQTAASYGAKYPDAAHLAVPYAAASIIALIGLEAAVLAAWQLLSSAVSRAGLNADSKRWADIMAASLGFMAVTSAGLFAHAGFATDIGGPAILFGLVVSLALIPAVVVLRNKTITWLANDMVYETPPGRG